MVTGLILCRPCAGKHHGCEFKRPGFCHVQKTLIHSSHPWPLALMIFSSPLSWQFLSLGSEVSYRCPWALHRYLFFWVSGTKMSKSFIWYLDTRNQYLLRTSLFHQRKEWQIKQWRPITGTLSILLTTNSIRTIHGLKLGLNVLTSKTLFRYKISTN